MKGNTAKFGWTIVLFVAIFGGTIGLKAGEPDSAVNIALNCSAVESDQGWGGGTNKMEITDGLRTYSTWDRGLAFTGGSGSYVEPAGPRQATIDFGEDKAFNKVVLWHHGHEHAPAEAQLAYWDGTNWINITSQRVFGRIEAGGAGSTSDEYTFPTITGSKVRYSFDNRLLSMTGNQIVHGWLYEFEVYEEPRAKNKVKIKVKNVAPTVVAGDDKAANEGSEIALAATFTDKGKKDTHVATIDWGDGSPVENIAPAVSPLNANHTYADNGAYTVTVTVTDDDGGVGTDTVTCTISNVAPSLTASAVADTIDEGSQYTINGSFTDPGSADTHTAVVDWGDGSTPETVVLNNKTFSATHVYGDSGGFPVAVKVTDDDGDSDTVMLSATVNEVEPEIVVEQDQTVDEGDTVSITVTVTDPGNDNHVLTLDWGDNMTEEITVSSYPFTIPKTHVYEDNGEFDVVVDVKTE